MTQTTEKLLITLVFLLVLAAAYFQWPAQVTASFQPEVPIVNPDPVWQHQVISDDATAATYAPVIINKPDGNQLAFWMGGTQDEHSDGQMYRIALSDGNAESAPEAVLSREQLSDSSHRAIERLGNPVLWYHGEQLVLAVVSEPAGNLEAARVDLLTSDDDGQSFAFQRTLRTSPFFNLSTRVRNATETLENGYLLPAYFDFNRTNPQLLSINEHLKLTRVTTSSLQGIEPALLPGDGVETTLLARSNDNGAVQSGRFNLGSGTTTAMTTMPALNNPSTAFDVLQITQDHWLMAHNPGLNSGALQLSISTDNGRSWQRVMPVTEAQGDAAQNDPSLTLDGQGLIHLVYSQSDRQIHYVRFTLAELLAGEGL